MTAKKKADVKKTGAREIWGIINLVFFVLLCLSLFSYDWHDIPFLHAPPNAVPNNMFGLVGAWLSYVLFSSFGLGAYSVPFVFLGAGLIQLLRRDDRILPKFGWGLLIVCAISGLLQVQVASLTETCAALNISGAAGGRLSIEIVDRVLIYLIKPLGASLICGTLLVVGAILFVGYQELIDGARLAVAWVKGLIQNTRTRAYERQDRAEQLEHEKREIQLQRERLEKMVDKNKGEKKKRKKRSRIEDEAPLPVREPEPEPEPEPTPEPLPEPVPEPKPEKPKKKKKALFKGRTEPEPEPDLLPDESSSVVDTSAYRLPPTSLLNQPSGPPSKSSKAELDALAKVLEDSLSEFGVEAEVTNVVQGPVVVQFEVLPAAGVRVERIANLSNNLALALKAASIRVLAPIPGKGVVGIEVPHGKMSIVDVRSIVESAAWRGHKQALPMILGQDVSGENLIVDLNKMPHILIAGATGAGKSVCMNSILMGLLMTLKPDELRLMLVDPKIVEFSVYENLPHLVVPIITDPKKVAIGLRWAIKEMEKRYKMFAKVGVRNIAGFNSRPIVEQQDLFGGDGDEDAETAKKEPEFPQKVPYIVIVIDELADLMLVAQADIENCIARLAQLSRAVGIHMIIATQRPSVNVITGTIKANFPARIAFQVAQKVDSRTILDSSGAEQLLGRGDMLYMPPGGTKTTRCQGSLTEDDEVTRVVEFIKNQGMGTSFEMAVQEKIESKSASVDSGEDDELLEQAITIIRETQRASTSSLQRRMRIGYTRAARLMDVLEERGVIGPPRGSDPREILIDLDEEISDTALDSETQEEYMDE